ncbi:hypothetical protein BSZ37_21145 [Rubrivirga marina]|uniref:Uncharacterized protein n=1 Tax=Rubrivirga marina TaxID=1196024 RepID=A0A271ISF7_9BACT|nr:hypothetical protein BSZ37_21145 [Rubrivirga marina]
MASLRLPVLPLLMPPPTPTYSKVKGVKVGDAEIRTGTVELLAAQGRMAERVTKELPLEPDDSVASVSSLWS